MAPSLPLPRLGRRARQAAWRVAAAVALAALPLLVLAQVAPGDAGAIALLTAAVFAAILGTRHVLAARADDEAEQRWLRRLLDDLDASIAVADDDGDRFVS